MLFCNDDHDLCPPSAHSIQNLMGLSVMYPRIQVDGMALKGQGGVNRCRDVQGGWPPSSIGLSKI